MAHFCENLIETRGVFTGPRARRNLQVGSLPNNQHVPQLPPAHFGNDPETNEMRQLAQHIVGHNIRRQRATDETGVPDKIYTAPRSHVNNVDPMFRKQETGTQFNLASRHFNSEVYNISLHYDE